MAFLPLLPSSGPVVRGKRLRIIVGRSGRNLDRRRVTFALSRELAEALNWQPSDRIVISLGLGTDRGRVQLVRVEKQRAGHKLITTPNSKVLRVSVTTPAVLQGEDVAPLLDAFLDPAAADFAIQDGALIATLQPLRASQAQLPPLHVVA
ncbi:hypothetical protein FG93_05514 [Bosea sp. LC85]|uniref:hypothetical protein n=1 Tax=Bosea sp. LC85 TaxID=1502851 RepID=UPI0004E38AB7|nr:hypothetical protein [Bosea sp. LC85]KFC64004.1 hypothetical protein FG93_05514 [Bosea sp. LC85]